MSNYSLDFNVVMAQVVNDYGEMDAYLVKPIGDTFQKMDP